MKEPIGAQENILFFYANTDYGPYKQQRKASQKALIKPKYILKGLQISPFKLFRLFLSR